MHLQGIRRLLYMGKKKKKTVSGPFLTRTALHDVRDKVFFSIAFGTSCCFTLKLRLFVPSHAETSEQNEHLWLGHSIQLVF